MTASSRRRFLGTAAGATGVALGAAVWGSGQAAAAVIPQGGAQPLLAADKRAFVAGNFFFNLDGVKTGFVKDTSGGGATADVVNEPVGATFYTKKHIGNVKYEDITLTVGFSMSKAIYDWISASWKQNFTRKNGSIVAADFNFEAKQERDFSNALITETGIPACDGSSKDAAYLSLKFAPEFTRTKKASGKVGGEFFKTEQKLWLPSNFRLEIDGLDCTKVNKVDAFTVKQTVVTNDIGDQRDVLKEPGKLEFPDLKITLSQVTAQSWYDWHEDFVIKGNCSDDKEKSGRLVFLSPNRQDEILEIKFFHLGIFELHDSTWDDDTGDTVARVKAELYCERMEFNYIGGGVKNPPPTPTPPPTG